MQAAGLSCIVLEAKDRVGGKTQSVRLETGNGVVDVGAAWINNTTQTKMYALFKRFGCETLVQRIQGDEIFRNAKGEVFKTAWPGLPPVDVEQLKVVEKIMEDMEVDSQSIDIFDSTANMHIEDISLSDYFRNKGAHGHSYDFWRAWIRALTGTEPDNIGLVFWLDYVKSCCGVESLLSDGPKGVQYMTNRKGM